ncbi:hypothetical protein AB0J83_14650 [Actinoplanes sp. NPDC049596]|uniref:hypothetical protein n=1 Tax=unclassified Actinoplanes TaxID=2626549 RepID=UPI00342F993E
MGHNICALIVREPFDEGAAREWDVHGMPLDAGLRLVHLSPAYTEHWQAKRGETSMLDVPADFPGDFPREGVVAALAAAVSGPAPTFALVMTEYFGGMGEQWACAFEAGRRVEGVTDINAALRVLGVRADGGLDEFDTAGLGEHRRTPDYLFGYGGQ